MKMKVKLIIMLIFLTAIMFFGTTMKVYATNFTPYADPSEIKSGQATTIHWGYQYGHKTSIELLDSNKNFVAYLVVEKYYNAGDNTFIWNGKIGQAPLSPGTYYIDIIPQDEWKRYKSRVELIILEGTEDGGGGIEPVKRPPNLSVTIDGPTTLTPQGNTYNQDQITMKVTITNTGEESAYNVKASLTKTPGLALHFTTNFTTINLDTIAPGKSKTVTWIFNVSTNQTADRVDNISIKATGSNVTNAYDNHSINVPGLVVIFIPGMAGTDLKTADDDEVWFIPYGNDYEAMAMNNNGTPVESLEPGDPVNYIWGYEEMVDFLDKNFNLNVFGYDWRWSNEETVKKLEARIKEIGASRVYIVAHSMGGLVANRYITKGNAGKIIKLVTLATPYMGSPKALYTLETGDLDLTGSNPDKLREIGRRMKSGYELLPSRKYFTLNDSNASNDTFYFRQRKQGSKPVEYKDFDSMITYLNSHPRLMNSFAGGADTFQKNLDLNLSGVDAYFIVAHGERTMGLLEDNWVRKSSGNKWEWKEIKKIQFIDGDKTVLLYKRK